MSVHLILINKSSVLGKPHSSIWKIEKSCMCPVLLSHCGGTVQVWECLVNSKEMDQHTGPVGILYMGKASWPPGYLDLEVQQHNLSWPCFSSVCETILHIHAHSSQLTGLRQLHLTLHAQPIQVFAWASLWSSRGAWQPLLHYYCHTECVWRAWVLRHSTGRQVSQAYPAQEIHKTFEWLRGTEQTNC